jgi:hypothetical protein
MWKLCENYTDYIKISHIMLKYVKLFSTLFMRNKLLHLLKKESWNTHIFSNKKRCAYLFHFGNAIEDNVMQL